MLFSFLVAAAILTALSVSAAEPVIKSARDCQLAEQDAVLARSDALIGDRYMAELDQYIASAKSACSLGDFEGAEAGYAMVRGMTASE